MIKRNNAKPGERCPWCGKAKKHFHSHHHPIPKAKGGKETVRICADCHESYHGTSGSVVVNCMRVKKYDFAGYEKRIRDFEEKVRKQTFPLVHNQLEWLPDIIILNPEWLSAGLRDGTIKEASA